MTTWAFNVLRELVAQPSARYLWIAPGAPEEEEFRAAQGVVIAKCHHFAPTLAEAADLVVYSYRDIRTAAVSYRRKFGAECNREMLDNWVEAERSWLPHADAILRYEDIKADPFDALRTLRELLARRLGAQALSAREDGEIVAAVEETFIDVEEGPVRFDASTMILPGHRTFQPGPEALSAEEKELYSRVEAQFGTWLSDHGYLAAANLGQEMEYEIARILLSARDAPTVLDVGVERGSFVELALRSGAARVIGFEPLPRHIEHLGVRFASMPGVTIHPIAVSRSSGTAVLHVATDASGRELDYHHTLSDLGDTATVVRSQRRIEVRTAALGDLARDGVVPSRIDFLKIDTDGHDLAVLEGLGELRPAIIMAEYWDTLPETSGTSEYSLADLGSWARAHGYSTMLVARRHGRIELVELAAMWSIPGDWGNVFFLRGDISAPAIPEEVQSLARERYAGLCDYVAALMREIEGKEAEIRRLDQGVKYAAKHAVDMDQAMREKEAVIDELRQAVQSFRRAPLCMFGRRLPILDWPLRAFARYVAPSIVPRLGVLHQHPPRALRLAAAPATPSVGLPTLCLVTPSFRQAAYIERTIESVLAQGYPALEYFIQDGGSDDGTVAILERYADRLAGWESRPDHGQSEAINRAFAHTRGEIMGWLNSDDILLPGALACVGQYFARHPEVDAVYGHRILIDEEDREIGRWMLPAHDDAVLSWVDFVPQETLFWRRSLWVKAGGRVDESFRFAMDWDLLVRFREAGARFARIPRFLGGFRVHPQQKTSAGIAEVGFREMDRIRERVLGRVPSRGEVHKAVGPYLMRHVAVHLGWRIRNKLGLQA